MIENARAALFAAAASSVLATGCHRASSVPDGFQGLIEYDQRTIGFEQPGRVAEVPVRRGQIVQAGDVIARLDATLQRAVRDSREAEANAARADLALLRAGTRAEDVAAAAADVSSASASEDLLRKSADRARRLLAEGAIPAAEVDRASAELDQGIARRKSLEDRLAALRRGSRPEEIARAEANVRQRDSALALEDERLARYILRAQESGAILDVVIKPGEFAATGTPAVSLADTGHPYADVFVPEGRLGGIQPGVAATARVDGLSGSLSAVVEYVSPQTEFTPKFLFSDRERPNLVIRVRVRIDDRDHRLHSGVPAFVKVGS